MLSFFRERWLVETLILNIFLELADTYRKKGLLESIGLDASSNIMQFSCLDATIDTRNKILFKAALRW